MFAHKIVEYFHRFLSWYIVDLSLWFLPLILFCFAVPTRFKAKSEKSVTAYKTWDAIIKCDIFGYPTPTITWTRSLNQLPLSRHVIDYNRLIIRNTTKDDDVAYVCQGTNKLSFLSIKINTPDVSTNVKELKKSDSLRLEVFRMTQF